MNTSLDALGATFNTSTGVMDWTPNYSQAGTYEFRITGTDGTLSDDELFVITVANTNRAPVLDAIGAKTIDEGMTLSIDSGDGGDDFDIDLDPVSYTCYYDTTVDGTVGTTNSCSSLGATFNASTGIFNWTPGYLDSGIYEFKITITDGFIADEEIFQLTVPNLPFVSLWRTTVENETITLPLKAGALYDFTVDWGDGSPISTVTSDSDADKAHTYLAAGDYTVTIDGQLTAWAFSYSGSRNKIIQVIDFGNAGWVDLEQAFMGCENLTHFSGGRTPHVTKLVEMFSSAGSYSDGLLVDLSNFDTTNVTDMSYMFYFSSIDSANFPALISSNTTDTSYMFYGTSLESLDLSLSDTSGVTNMGGMFGNSYYLNNLDLSTFDTSNVQDMSYMFYDMASLTNLNISNFNTSNVKNMSNMFYYTLLTSLDLSHFDTSNVTDMSEMFSCAELLTSLNISSFNTANVTNMSEMFYATHALSTLDLTNFDTSKVTDFSLMFGNADALTSLDLSSFNTSAATTMARMFRGTSSLSSLNISSFDTTNVTSAYSMFQSSAIGGVLDLSHFNTANFTDVRYMFNNAPNLTGVNLNTWDVSAVTLSTSVFLNMTGVVYCDQGGTPGTGSIFGVACAAGP